jgi:hypothetical protein
LFTLGDVGRRFQAGLACQTISLELDAYERLRKAKRWASESFSSVVEKGHIPRNAPHRWGSPGNLQESAESRQGAPDY